MSDHTNGPAPGFLIIWWRNGAFLPFAVGVFAIIVGLSSFNSLRAGLEFDSRGVVVVGDVVDRRTAKRQTNDRTKTDYYVSIRYETADGPVEIERRVSRAFFNVSRVGAQHDVRYLPSRPRRVEFTISETWDDGQTARWISLIAGVLALGSFWWTARPAVEAMRARRYGRSERGIVTHIDSNQHKNGRSYQLVWRTESGGEGRSMSSSSKAHCLMYPPGSQIELFRDSKGRTWWVGDVGPRATAPTVPDAGKSTS